MAPNNALGRSSAANLRERHEGRVAASPSRRRSTASQDPVTKASPKANNSVRVSTADGFGAGERAVSAAEVASRGTGSAVRTPLEEFEANLYPKTRAKIEERLNSGWKFDHAKWSASIARHMKWDMSKVFKQFDTDGDGYLGMREFMRAFRALGLEKRGGGKMKIDLDMFNSFDTNGDGVVSVTEFENGLLPSTRKKIEAKLDAGWKFDAKAWAASEARHAKD